MNILIAPDSFKGSLSAVEFCDIADRALQNLSRVHSKYINTCLMPLADGGEGTIEAVLTYIDGHKSSVNVNNAIGISTFAHYVFLDKELPNNPFAQHTAIIEMAQACSLPDIHPSRRNPMKTSTFGVGELIKHALDQGARKLIIGLGGSATNDGGMGMLSALGVQFYTRDGKSVKPAGQMLELIERIDISRMDPRLQECSITIASDVTNPLLGEQGATQVFAAQKGADTQMIKALEKGMASYANRTIQTLGLSEELLNTAGAGAAGGLGFALLAYLKAEIQSGFELMAQLAGLDKLLHKPESRPDMIISGEGCFDQQSLNGKLTGQIIAKADQYKIPVTIICGDYSPDIKRLLNPGTRLMALKENSMSEEQAMQSGAVLLEKKISELFTE